MAPKETLSDLIKELDIPDCPEKDVSGLIWDFLKKDPEKSTRTDEDLASYPQEDIAVFAVDFVKEFKVRLRGARGTLSSSTNKTLIECHVRDIMYHLVRNRCKPKKTQLKSPNTTKAPEKPGNNFFVPRKAVSKNTRFPQAAKKITIEIANPALENQKRTSDVYEVSDGEEIFHSAVGLLSPPNLKNTFNTPKNSLPSPQNRGESSRSTTTPAMEMAKSQKSPRMTEDAKINKSPEKELPTDTFPTMPQSAEWGLARANIPSQPGTTLFNTSPSKTRPSLFKSSLFVNRKRTIEDVEPGLGIHPSLTPTPNRIHPGVFGPELPNAIPSPSPSTRHVRPRTARSRSPSPTPAADSAPLILVRGNLYRVDALAQIADHVLKYVRECENKCLKYEGQVQLPHQKSLLLGHAAWLKDMHNDLESRIESLAADAPANARIVTSWIERQIDSSGLPQIVAASSVATASVGDAGS